MYANMMEKLTVWNSNMKAFKIAH